MKVKILVILSALAVLSIRFNMQDTRGQAKVEEQVKALVEKLCDDDPKVREKATKELEELGFRHRKPAYEKLEELLK